MEKDTQWHRRAAEIIEEAQELPAPERSDFVEMSCGEDGELLREVLEHLQIRNHLDQLSQGAQLTYIGPYKLESELGRGGMGRVFLGKRELPFPITVAIKIIDLRVDDEQGRRRFKLEQFALSRMNSAYIPKIYDSGETDGGLPYFVMEYIDGTPITEYCTQNRLDLEARLQLFLDVCEAVDHAHLKLMAHRDLKPEHILVVVEGEKLIPKLIDFGIARSLEAGATKLTGMQIPGTLEYMAPERILGGREGVNDDPRADIYSLGVVLYQLVAGCLPLEEQAEQSLLNRIDHFCNKPVNSPSQAFSQLTQDRRQQWADGLNTTESALVKRLAEGLNLVVLKCLGKEPRDRYRSAAELADDLQRFLDGRLVAAGPLPRWIRFKRLTRRNKLAVTAVTLTLLLLIAVPTTYGITIAGQRARLETERDTARKSLEMMVSIFKSSEPVESEGKEVLARDLLDRGVARIGENKNLEPTTRAALLHTLGEAYMSLSLFKQAKPLLDEAAKLRAQFAAVDSEEYSQTWYLLGVWFDQTGQAKEALPLLERALTHRQVHLGKDHMATSTVHSELSICYSQLGDYTQARLHASRAYEIARTHRGDRDRDTLIALANLAGLEAAVGNLDLALSTYLKAREKQKTILAPSHPDSMSLEHEIAVILRSLGRLEESEQRFLALVPLYEQVYPTEHKEKIRILNELGQTQQQLGKVDLAKNSYLESLEMSEKLLGPLHGYTGSILTSLGLLQYEQGNWPDALVYYERVAEIDRETIGPEHPYYAISLNNLGTVLDDLGRFFEAEQCYKQSLAIKEAKFGKENVNLLNVYSNMASLYVNWGKPDLVLRYMKICSKILEDKALAEHPMQFTVATNKMVSYLSKGDLENAQSCLQQAEPYLDKEVGKGSYRKGNFLQHRGMLKASLGFINEAFADLLQARVYLSNPENKTNLNVAVIDYKVAQLLLARDDFEEALFVLNEAHSIFRDAYGQEFYRSQMVEGHRAYVLARLGRHEEAQQILATILPALCSQHENDFPPLVKAELVSAWLCFRYADHLEGRARLAALAGVWSDGFPSEVIALGGIAQGIVADLERRGERQLAADLSRAFLYWRKA